MDKRDRYHNLIFKRQSILSLPDGLLNYHETGFEINHIDAWEMWHSNLDADIMVIGQDFADAKTFIRDEGRVEPMADKYAYATNKNLATLFESGLGIQIGHPLNPNPKAKLFFTNAIIGLKQHGGMQGKVQDEWAISSVKEFIKPLIEIVRPKVVFVLGRTAFKAVYKNFADDISLKANISRPFRELVGHKFQISNSTLVYPVYHCGSRGVNMNQKLEDQIKVWEKIGSANNILTI